MAPGINIRICTGTTCYVMGASDLLTLADQLTESTLKGLNISGAPCLGYCRNRDFKPPFVEINGRLLAGATVERVKEAIIAETEDKKYAYDK